METKATGNRSIHSSEKLFEIFITIAVNQVGSGGFSNRYCPFKVVTNHLLLKTISLAVIKFLDSIKSAFRIQIVLKKEIKLKPKIDKSFLSLNIGKASLKFLKYSGNFIN